MPVMRSRHAALPVARTRYEIEGRARYLAVTL